MKTLAQVNAALSSGSSDTKKETLIRAKVILEAEYSEEKIKQLLDKCTLKLDLYNKELNTIGKNKSGKIIPEVNNKLKKKHNPQSLLAQIESLQYILY